MGIGRLGILVGSLLALVLCSGCAALLSSPPEGGAASPGADAAPLLAPAPLGDGERLRVVATTTIVADVVRRVGGSQIELYTMLPVGADPHNYNPTPQDLRAAADAHLIFVNGLGLEEFLSKMLENAGGSGTIVAVNDAVELLTYGEAPTHDAHADDAPTHDAHADDAHADDAHADDAHADDAHADDAHADDAHTDHAHGDHDPHTWFSVPSVLRWVDTIAYALGALDPAHREQYEQAADLYRTQLTALHVELLAMAAQIPAERRKLVTDHDAFGYFAHAYGFTVVGTVIEGFSTAVQPSAQELAALQDQVRQEGVPAIFVGTTVNQNLATQLAADLGVRLVPVYTGSLSGPDGPATSYSELMRYNMQVIVEALGG